jgi:neurotransmitter:Na+ symporter, NSS family
VVGGPVIGISRPGSGTVRWSSQLACHLGAAGAAVGLGSIWRFPYLVGSGGGGAFIVVFVLACVVIALPLLAAEFALGRHSRASPPEAARAIAAEAGLSARWGAIGVLGTIAAFLIASYYMVIAGWVLAYAWKCAYGMLAQAGSAHVRELWSAFLLKPREVAAWHALFLVLVAFVSAQGLSRGIEAANRIRGPSLLVLLLILVGYSLLTADVRRGLQFAFRPDFSALNGQVILTAIGQAFYATGVGQAMMIAYGAYIPRGTSLVRTSLVICASILLVSLLASVIIFPLVFAYGMDPAQGSQLVFEVLPRVFIEMPAGRLIGTLFFLLLALAALMPSIALLEPAVAWLIDRYDWSRERAVCVVASATWVLGLGSVLGFNVWASWRPLAFIPALANRNFLESVDYVASNLMLPLGALLTSIFLGWRVARTFAQDELAETSLFARRASVWLLRYVCPVAITAVFIAALS